MSNSESLLPLGCKCCYLAASGLVAVSFLLSSNLSLYSIAPCSMNQLTISTLVDSNHDSSTKKWSLDWWFMNRDSFSWYKNNFTSDLNHSMDLGKGLKVIHDSNLTHDLYIHYQQVSLPTTPLLVGSQKRKTKKASSGKGGSGLIKRARKSEEEVTSTQNISAFMKGVSHQTGRRDFLFCAWGSTIWGVPSFHHVLFCFFPEVWVTNWAAQ